MSHAYSNFSLWKECFSTFLMGCLFHMLAHAALSWVFLEGRSSICLFFHLQLLPLLTSQHFAQPTDSDLGCFRSDAVRGAARLDWVPLWEVGCSSCNPSLVLRGLLAVLPPPPSACTSPSGGRGLMGRGEDNFFIARISGLMHRNPSRASDYFGNANK